MLNSRRHLSKTERLTRINQKSFQYFELDLKILWEDHDSPFMSFPWIYSKSKNLWYINLKIIINASTWKPCNHTPTFSIAKRESQITSFWILKFSKEEGREKGTNMINTKQKGRNRNNTPNFSSFFLSFNTLNMYVGEVSFSAAE